MATLTTQLGTGQGQEEKGCAWGQWPQDEAGGLGFAWPCMQPDPSHHTVTHLTGHHPELHPAPVALFCIYPVGGLEGGGQSQNPTALPFQDAHFPQTGEDPAWQKPRQVSEDTRKEPLKNFSF